METYANQLLTARRQTGNRAQEGQLLRGAIQTARSQRGPRKAICAVAASMLTAIYHMLKDGTHHQDIGAAHFDRRSSEAKSLLGPS